MKPTIKEIYSRIDEYAPFSYAEAWDNSGFQVGDAQKTIDRVLVALDLDDEVLSRAVAEKADLIVTHHPLLFHALKQVTTDDFIARRVIGLVENGIGYIAAHTNYDVAVMGRLAASKFGMKHIAPLEVTGEADGQPIGIGVIGEIEPTDLKTLVFKTKIAYDLDAVRVYGHTGQIRRLAVCPGSGGGKTMQYALQQGAECYISGDISHHDGIDALAQGMRVIDAGHAGLEHVFVQDLSAMLRISFPAVYVDTVEKSSPFETI